MGTRANGAGSGIRKYDGYQAQYDSHHLARIGILQTEIEEPRNQGMAIIVSRSDLLSGSGLMYAGWSDAVLVTLSLVVPQPGRCLCALSPGSGVRARLEPFTDLVRHADFGCDLGVLWLTGFSADLELTVSLLVQMDKLVMLIESPVFLSTPFVPALNRYLLTG